MYRKYLKRAIDFVAALTSILLLSSLMLLIAIVVRLKLGSPILFKQDRPGKNEKTFRLYKFRTMNDKRDANGTLFSDKMRLTSFGKFLRSTSLDELPSLFNIVIGQMSFIGPRPQLIEDMFFMTKEQRHRHIVRPGLSGYAQVNGRNAIDWEKKLKMDLIYIDNQSFVGDFLIFINTIIKVVRRSDISYQDTTTSLNLGDYLLNKNIISNVEYSNTKKKIREFRETKNE